MSSKIRENLQKIFVLGISYRKSTLDIREKFSIKPEDKEKLLRDAKKNHIEGMMVLFTCNRTEIYGYSSDINAVVGLLLKYCKGSLEDFNNYSYVHKGNDCIKHLYKITSGMESQIVGDFQIAGQVRDAYRLAEKENMINPFMNRLFSFVFQANKKIKTETDLSKGAASVSHASVQFIKNQVNDLNKCRFLLFGTGDVGKVTCENLLKHTDNRSLTLINRTQEKAKTLAEKYQIKYCNIDKLTEEVKNANVIIVATGASTPTLRLEHFKNTCENKLVLDLSVPRNVETTIDNIENVSVISIDELSKQTTEATKQRLKCLPAAQNIIDASIDEFYGWLEVKYLSPVIVALKDNLQRIQQKELDYHRSKLSDDELKKVEHITGNIVNKIARACINHLKDHHKRQSSPMETLELIFKENEE